MSGSASHSACHSPAERSCVPCSATSRAPLCCAARMLRPTTASLPIGFAFCGIVDEAPRRWPPSSRTSPISGRESSITSLASLPQVPAVAASDEACLGHGIARGVPGHVDDPEPEPLGDTVPDRRGSRVRARPRCRPRRRAGRRRARARAARSRSQVARQLGEPHGQLAAEGDRDGRLGVRAAGHHGRAVSVGLRRELVAERSRERLDPIERPAAEQGEARVHDVLRRRAPVDVPGGLGGSIADLLEQRQDRIADDERPRAQSLQVDGLRYRGPLDRRGGLGGDDPELGLRGGERPLDLEPRLDERPLREESPRPRRRRTRRRAAGTPSSSRQGGRR